MPTPKPSSFVAGSKEHTSMPAIASHLYQNPENPWVMIDSPFGRMEAWRASTLCTGTMGAMASYLDVATARADDASARIADARARADTLNEREASLSARETVLKDTIRKLDALFHRADFMLTELEERQQQTVQDEEEQQELETNLPGGELHDIPAKETQDPDDPDPIGDQGDLPENLQIPELGTYPTLEDPHKPQAPQPVSVSLNNIEDDDDGPIA
jgi:hypothetical protein